MTNGSFPGALDMSTAAGPSPKLPAAATTTMPLNQSLSTALSSGSIRKLVFDALAIEKLATRMLYFALFAMIQSTAAITSLVTDLPLASAVRMLTIGACCTAPGWSGLLPAAMPATIVPWPSSSPVAVGARDERFTFATRRPPKSLTFDASTPLSTIAIAGAGGARPIGSQVDGSIAFQRGVMSVVSRHISAFSYPASRTGSSGVIAAMPGSLDSWTSCEPLSLTDVADNDLKVRLTSPLLLFLTSFSTSPLLVPLLPCTMTLKYRFGLAVAAASRLAGTTARVVPMLAYPVPFPFPAMPATGIRRAATRADRTTAERPPRRPQSALERRSLREPRPQSALDRVPSVRRPRSFRIESCSFHTARGAGRSQNRNWAEPMARWGSELPPEGSGPVDSLDRGTGSRRPVADTLPRVPRVPLSAEILAARAAAGPSRLGGAGGGP